METPASHLNLHIPTPRWAALCLALLVAATYANSLQGPFVLDDGPNIVDNLLIRAPWPPWELLASTERPIAEFSFAINYAIGGLNTLGYPLGNVLIHIGCALLLFGVARRALSNGKAGRQSSPEDATALAIAALWAVHPLQTQAVTYIVQRHESLMSFFYLLTIYAVARCASGKRPFAWGMLACIVCALGMGTKQVMVSAPIVALLFDRTFLAGSFRRALKLRFGLYIGLALSWGALFAAMGGNLWNPEEAGFVERPASSGLDYLWSQPGVLLHYLGMVLWPHPQVFDYAWPAARGLRALVLPTVTMSIIAGATLWALYYRPGLGFLGASFFLILAPSSSFMPIADLAFEHRMYLPSAVVLALLVLGVRRAARSWNAVPAWAPACLTFVVTAVLALWTVRRNEDYRSAVSLWETVASNAAHNQRAFINLGIAYVKEENNLSAAQEALERALILKPGNVRALVNLAGVYMERGQPKEAIAKLEKVLAVEPDNAEVICNIGVALSAGGDLKGARAHVERAVSIDPAYAQGHNNLGVILMKSGKLTAAARAFERALEIDREYREARSNLESVQRRLEGRRARRENAGSAPPLR